MKNYSELSRADNKQYSVAGRYSSNLCDLIERVAAEVQQKNKREQQMKI